MPYVRRNALGEIESVHRAAAAPEVVEYLDASNPELQRFMSSIEQASPSAVPDPDFLRALEDIVDMLLAKGLIDAAELPLSAQERLVAWNDRRAQAALERSRQFAASGFVEVIDDSAFDLLGKDTTR
jgi:hypothetical protein